MIIQYIQLACMLALHLPSYVHNTLPIACRYYLKIAVQRTSAHTQQCGHLAAFNALPASQRKSLSNLWAEQDKADGGAFRGTASAAAPAASIATATAAVGPPQQTQRQQQTLGSIWQGFAGFGMQPYRGERRATAVQPALQPAVQQQQQQQLAEDEETFYDAAS